MTLQLAKLRHLVLDMDGTIYTGGTLFDCTRPFLELLAKLELGFTFLTNNSSRSGVDYLNKLHSLGLDVQLEQIFTSGMAAIEYLGANHPTYQRLFVLGTKSLRQEYLEAGFELLDDVDQGTPHAVIVAFDAELEYQRLCTAAYWIDQGLPFIATHPDRVCPTDLDTVLVDCGAITACLTTATGRSPNAILGKPHPMMLEGILRRHGLQTQQLAMVGDRLATDIEMAKVAGVGGVLVLTGEATSDDAERHPTPPDLVVADLAALGELLAESRST